MLRAAVLVVDLIPRFDEARVKLKWLYPRVLVLHDFTGK